MNAPDPTAQPARPTADVTVVMPCYNGLPYITQALDSALAQTVRPARIVVVDDGSKDLSAQAVRAYAARFPDWDIQLIQQANAGEPAARNAGIRASQTTWVAMLDTDDWWDPRKLELQLKTADEAGPQCVLVHTGTIGHLPGGREKPGDMTAAARRTGWCTQALLEPSSIGHPSIMVRRAALEEIGGYDEAFKQACDIDLYFRLSAVGTFAFVPQYLLHYRYHAGQMSRSQLDQVRYHHRAVHKFFERHPDIHQRIGKDHVREALANHVAVKLESLYWRRSLADFRGLLKYARAEGLENPTIAHWRQKSVWPDWLIRLKDRLTGSKGS